jgi:hypothetical protein
MQSKPIGFSVSGASSLAAPMKSSAVAKQAPTVSKSPAPPTASAFPKAAVPSGTDKTGPAAKKDAEVAALTAPIDKSAVSAVKEPLIAMAMDAGVPADQPAPQQGADQAGQAGAPAGGPEQVGGAGGAGAPPPPGGPGGAGGPPPPGGPPPVGAPAEVVAEEEELQLDAAVVQRIAAVKANGHIDDAEEEQITDALKGLQSFVEDGTAGAQGLFDKIDQALTTLANPALPAGAARGVLGNLRGGVREAEIGNALYDLDHDVLEFGRIVTNRHGQQIGEFDLVTESPDGAVNVYQVKSGGAGGAAEVNAQGARTVRAIDSLRQREPQDGDSAHEAIYDAARARDINIIFTIDGDAGRRNNISGHVEARYELQRNDVIIYE